VTETRDSDCVTGIMQPNPVSLTSGYALLSFPVTP
jgi:hypothetical protein